MTQTFDLKNMGFAEIQNEELEVVDGGGFWAAIAAATVGTAFTIGTGGAGLLFTGALVAAAYAL